MPAGCCCPRIEWSGIATTRLTQLTALSLSFSVITNRTPERSCALPPIGLDRVSVVCDRGKILAQGAFVFLRRRNHDGMRSQNVDGAEIQSGPHEFGNPRPRQHRSNELSFDF